MFLLRLTTKGCQGIGISRDWTTKCELKRERVQIEEKEAINDGDLDEAQRSKEKLNDLRERQILLRNFLIVEHNQQAFKELQAQNEEAIDSFNQRWAEIIQDLENYAKEMEEGLESKHYEELLTARSAIEQQVQRKQRAVNNSSDRFKLS